ncbi:MAG: ERCC4 domain-containing protein [Candidatus Limnocylindrales bacterium]
MSRRFLVARNPDPASTLPYLLLVPIGDGLALKARDSWPRTSRVYCHRLDVWPDDAEIVEDVPVLECRRRGIAVDLVLDRKREYRSQFVFTRMARGREGIFWQTRKVASTARPGARIPGRRISDLPGPMSILVDTRERYPYRFSKQQAETERRALPAGDYAVCDNDGTIIAAVERKSVGDLAGSLNDGSMAFELGRLATLPRSALVVEDRYAALLKLEHAPSGYLPDLLARVQVRYPETPIVFTETRPLAEEWTYRWLGAALAEHLATGDAWGDDVSDP